jgi:hypothetical protein
MFESFTAHCNDCDKDVDVMLIGLANDEDLKHALRDKQADIRVMHLNADGDPPKDCVWSLDEREKEKLRGQIGIAA